MPPDRFVMNSDIEDSNYGNVLIETSTSNAGYFFNRKPENVTESPSEDPDVLPSGTSTPYSVSSMPLESSSEQTRLSPTEQPASNSLVDNTSAPPKEEVSEAPKTPSPDPKPVRASTPFSSSPRKTKSSLKRWRRSRSSASRIPLEKRMVSSLSSSSSRDAPSLRIESSSSSTSSPSYSPSSSSTPSPSPNTPSTSSPPSSSSSPKSSRKSFYPSFITYARNAKGSFERTTPNSHVLMDTNPFLQNDALIQRKRQLMRSHPSWFASIFPNRKRQGICVRCELCVAGKHCRPYITEEEDWTSSSRHSFNVTAIMVATESRISFFKYLLPRWKGPLIVTILVNSTRIVQVKKQLKAANLPPSTEVILMVASPKSPHFSHFPINRLRNIAIRHVTTSHFLVLDMDLWPSPNTYDTLMHLPRFIRKSKQAAVILPAFFAGNREELLQKCDTLDECAELSATLFPDTKMQLKKDLFNGVMTSTKGVAQSHMYVVEQWSTMEPNTVGELSCFPSRFQEPYVMLRFDNSTLLFDERFIDYGCNKVQYIDHLRYMGYRFYIVSDAFATDVLHHDSSHRTAFLEGRSAFSKPDMSIVCYNYLYKVDQYY
ncbi:hypothetical protein WA588_002878, partial [Blastocystis sp. NMH]